MPWRQITITTDEQSAPQIADWFSDLGAVSVTYLDAEDEPVYEPGIGETKIWRRTQVAALFELDADPELIKLQLLTKFVGSPLDDWQLEDVADQAWELAWMDYYRPMKFGDKLWVCPTGQTQQEAGTVCLILDPGLAFGTGTHPTTALCLEWLAGHDLSDNVVIDYGCGSGILAIAALLLGARHAYAIDIDPQALTATYDNALKNQVQNRISCYYPEQLPMLQAQVVLANILAKPLIELSENICALLAPKGYLILSGILQEQAEATRQAYQTFITMAPPVQKEDWIRLEGVKP
jgi:ribosomal protein L11 methyltransferase